MMISVYMSLVFFVSLFNSVHVNANHCGYQTNDLEGTIESPEDNYYQSASCVWNITLPTGYQINLRSTRFNLAGNSGRCSDGWLIISGTAENNTNIQKKFCGTREFPEVLIFKNRVNMEYNYHNRNGDSHYFTLVYHGVPVPTIEMTTEWIKNNTNTLLGDKKRLPLVIPALYLSDETYFFEGNEIGYKFKVQYLLRLSEDLLRNTTELLSLADLSQHVTALLAICSNPRSFRGIDLVRHLRRLADEHPTLVNPFDILTLCNAGDNITSSDIKRLSTILKTAESNPFLLDFKAIGMMALICAKQQNEELAVDEVLQETVNELKLTQNKDGGYGSLQTTSLVYQALSAAGAYGWDSTAALKFISRSNHSDGSFGNLDDLYAVLPALKDKTLLEINASKCDFSEDGVTPLQEVKDKMTKLISVNYQLFIGDEGEVRHTITLKLPNGTNFVDIMRLAAEKNEKYQLKWTFVKDNIYVYSLSNIINNPTSGKYWRLYTYVEGQNLVLFDEGLEKYVPSDGVTAVMWYKTIDLVT